jgi:hypothetical protein
MVDSMFRIEERMPRALSFGLRAVVSTGRTVVVVIVVKTVVTKGLRVSNAFN